MGKNVNDYKKFKKLGIMGGTFDPIHFGHLHMAEQIREKYKLDKVIFVPTGNSPHKQSLIKDSKLHRNNMTKIAIENNTNFLISDMEIFNEEISYSIDTVKNIKKLCNSDVELYFIVGADTLKNIKTWKNYEELLTLCVFVVVDRFGNDKEGVRLEIERLIKEKNAQIEFCAMNSFPISSTEIRESLKNNCSVKYMLPFKVEKYIYDNNLYKYKEIDAKTIKTIKKNLKKLLSKSRYEHSIGVSETAVKLAKLHNINPKNAYLAGIMHDYSKEMSKEDKLKYCKAHNIVLDDIMKSKIDLAHGYISASIANEEYNICNKDILNAIAFHTTGRANMSKLEKVIFISDVIEPNRKIYNKEDFEEIKDIKRKSQTSLDQAVKACLERKIKFNENAILHPLTLEALNYLNNI